MTARIGGVADLGFDLVGRPIGVWNSQRQWGLVLPLSLL